MLPKPPLLLLLLLLPLGAAAQTVTVPPTTYGAGPAVVTGATEITNGTNTVTVSASATVVYHATTKVTLKPGFQATAGSKFFVQIGGSLDSDGDGIPNLWEVAHGLNPNNASDAQGTIPGGSISYLFAYQLGLRLVAAQQNDGGNASQLNVHRPNTP